MTLFRMYLKLIHPECYAFGGFTYKYEYEYDFEKEYDALMEVGFDGMKMVENKPSVRKALGVPFCDSGYDAVFRKMEANGIPLLSHVANPKELKDSLIINRMQQDFLEKDGIIPAWEKYIVGIHLTTDVTDKIYYKNFLRFAGEKPKPINKEAAVKYIENRLSCMGQVLTEEEKGICWDVLKSFE